MNSRYLGMLLPILTISISRAQEQVNAGAIGDGHTADPKKPYSLFEIPVRKAKKFTYLTVVPVTDEDIEKDSLPARVTGINGTLKRESGMVS